MGFQQDLRSFDCTEYYVSYDQGHTEGWEAKCSFVDMLCSTFQALCDNPEEKRFLVGMKQFIAEIGQLDFLDTRFQIGTSSEWAQSELRKTLLETTSSFKEQAVGFFVEAIDSKTAVSVSTARILHALARRDKPLRDLIVSKMPQLKAVGDADISNISEGQVDCQRYIEWYEAAGTSLPSEKLVTIASRVEDATDSCEIDARLALLLRSRAPSPRVIAIASSNCLPPMPGRLLPGLASLLASRQPVASSGPCGSIDGYGGETIFRALCFQKLSFFSPISGRQQKLE